MDNGARLDAGYRDQTAEADGGRSQEGSRSRYVHPNELFSGDVEVLPAGKAGRSGKEASDGSEQGQAGPGGCRTLRSRWMCTMTAEKVWGETGLDIRPGGLHAGGSAGGCERVPSADLWSAHNLLPHGIEKLEQR